MEKNSMVTAQAAQRKTLVRIALTALFAALIAAGSFISIPLAGSPVPIVLKNMFVLLSGLILGPLLGGGAAGLYLLAGVLGAPVFAGAGGGFVPFLSPTGGFLIGYPLMAIAAGCIAGRPRADYKTPAWRIILAVIIGMLIVYIPGVIWFKIVVKDTTWQGAIAQGFLPFIIGDTVKGIAAGIIAPRLRRAAADHLGG